MVYFAETAWEGVEMVWVLPRRRVRWLHTCHGNNSRETPTQKYRSFGCETSEHRLHGIISDFDIPMDLSMQKKPFDNLRSLALVDEEGELELLETADLRKFKDTTLFDEFDQVGDRSHLKHLPANYEDINGKEVTGL